MALVAAAIPGRGHDFFKGWLEKLAGYLLRKAAYSLVLAILLAVNGALRRATSALGWLMSFGLQALFFWAVFLQRKTLAESLVGIATGPRAPGREGSLRLLALYCGRADRGRALRDRRCAALAPRAVGRARVGLADGVEPRRPAWRRPVFGTSDRAPVGGGKPALERAPGRGACSPGGRAQGMQARTANGSCIGATETGLARRATPAAHGESGAVDPGRRPVKRRSAWYDARQPLGHPTASARRPRLGARPAEPAARPGTAGKRPPVRQGDPAPAQSGRSSELSAERRGRKEA